MWSVKWIVLWSLWVARVVRQPTLEVRVSNGWLRGTVAASGSHFQYLGIPYATIVKRFQEPGPEPTWHGVFDAVNENLHCNQELFFNADITVGRPDCLFLNVYTPMNTSPEDSLPVMVYIHGGGFFEGGSSRLAYGPEYFTQKGVILVTVNYRLNVQGFLCLRIKEAPGNAGLKDQVAALKWVQRNIKAFGGNSDNVTIFGESAGAVAVSLHMMSPMSKGLFHKAIMQSGSSLASWALQFEPLQAASSKAKVLGLQSTHPNALYNFYINQTDANLITKKVPRSEGNILMSQLLFLPCVEKEIDGVQPFLTESPFEILSKGNFSKVPMIIGVNSEEGLFFANTEVDELIPQIKIEASLPKNLVFPSNFERSEVAKDIESIFMGGQKVSYETLYNFSKYIGETFMEYPIYEETNIILRNSDQPVYSYLFSYEGWRNIPKTVLSRRQLRYIEGASHADEIFYLFSQKLIPSFFENLMIDKMTTMWTNFAKYGDPTPSPNELLPLRWPPLAKEKDDHQILLIDQSLNIVPQPKKPSYVIWENVFSKYRRKL